ncbi:hypothetical protein G7Y29_08490 [Corynebacterium qintianiae]|uniref:Uncharacterized protein n=1 Tax=Corynebacterium qintianiae TaxID=2709392 RepID=A0A7T0PFJ5_9CORY|nr:hypothetical protein [Corynebacterium qintianiae]QPK82892.1 hypothetical protein G7Y29_08490 [Corynebacterium qintianiae]
MENKDAAVALETVTRVQTTAHRTQPANRVRWVYGALIGAAAGFCVYDSRWGVVVALGLLAVGIALAALRPRATGVRQAVRQPTSQQPKPSPVMWILPLLLLGSMPLIPKGNAVWAVIFGVAAAVLVTVTMLMEDRRAA